MLICSTFFGHGCAAVKGPRLVCKLTGAGSHNYVGSGVQVKGTDLGSMFEHKGRMYFAFGDTNINAPKPSNDLSNVLAYSTDMDASDCIDLHYITMRDLFKDPAGFYAEESVLQAAEEAREERDIDPGISNGYQAHYDRAAAGPPAEAKAELLRKTRAIFEHYAGAKKAPAALADYYARLSARLAGFAVSFSDDITEPSIRNSQSYDAHYEWALNASSDALFSETALRYDRLFEAVEEGRVKQIFASKTFPGEFTDIPTNGISIGGRIYIYIMSIKGWKPWTANFCALAYSDDDGRTFTRIDHFFPADSNFIQVALVNRGGYLYLFGIPAAREGGVKLGRVREDKVLDRKAYRFYKAGGWIESEFDADVIVPPPVGELAVHWNPFLNAWLMTYLNDPGRAVESRTSPELAGPWSAPAYFVGNPEVASINGGGLYAPFFHPAYAADDGRTLYFLLSLWTHYNVFVLKTPLPKPGPSSLKN